MLDTGVLSVVKGATLVVVLVRKKNYRLAAPMPDDKDKGTSGCWIRIAHATTTTALGT